MSKDRTITDGKLPDKVCPICGKQVLKAIRYGQLSYICNLHWGPWDEAKPRSTPSKDTRCEVHDLLMGDGKCSCGALRFLVALVDTASNRGGEPK